MGTPKPKVAQWRGSQNSAVRCCPFANSKLLDLLFLSRKAGVAKLVYAPDSKSGEVKLMSVRVRPPAPNLQAFLPKNSTLQQSESKPSPGVSFRRRPAVVILVDPVLASTRQGWHAFATLVRPVRHSASHLSRVPCLPPGFGKHSAQSLQHH